MQGRWFFWLLCAIASALVLSINISNMIDAIHSAGQSRAVEGVVRLIGIDTSKGPTKNGSTSVHSARLKFIAEDGKSFSLSEFPNRPFKSSNWDGLVQDIKELTSQKKVIVYCSNGYDGCFVYADASGNTKLWLLISGLALPLFVGLSYASKRKHAIKWQT